MLAALLAFECDFDGSLDSGFSDEHQFSMRAEPERYGDLIERHSGRLLFDDASHHFAYLSRHPSPISLHFVERATEQSTRHFLQAMQLDFAWSSFDRRREQDDLFLGRDHVASYANNSRFIASAT